MNSDHSAPAGHPVPGNKGPRPVPEYYSGGKIPPFPVPAPATNQPEQCYTLLSDEERSLLKFEINCAVRYFLDLDRPVHLETLGILHPELHEGWRPHVIGTSMAMRLETQRSVSFEKCDDLIALPADFLAQVVQTKDLTKRIYPKLPLPLQLKWRPDELRKILRAFFQHMRARLVKHGHSASLSAIGDFFALHNRQGSTPSEWYAGADIFIKARPTAPVSVRNINLFPRPTLESAWEPLQAAYGQALREYRSPLRQLLDEHGLLDEVPDLSSLTPDQTLSVAVFHYQLQGKSVLAFCTNSLRMIGLSRNKAHPLGNELIFQLGADPQSLDRPALPDIAARFLLLGWILMQSSKLGVLKTGIGVSAPAMPGQEASRLSSVLVTSYEPASFQQLSAEGPFLYQNLVGITADEALLISRQRRNHLLAMLETRGLHQVTYPKRSSVFARSQIEPPLAMAS